MTGPVAHFARAEPKPPAPAPSLGGPLRMPCDVCGELCDWRWSRAGNNQIGEGSGTVYDPQCDCTEKETA